MKNADCGGNKPQCLTKTANGFMWPGGYCTSTCNPNKNDNMTGANPACPGGGICVGQGSMGICETNCTDMKGMMPCTRAGYVCNQGCEPAAVVECDPTKTIGTMPIGPKGSCPQDGGVLLPNQIPDGGNPDSGTFVYSGRTCVRIGAEVGVCADGCNPLVQNCPAGAQGGQQACYASSDTGEGDCFNINSMGNDGDACNYINDCNPGLGCWSPPGMMNAMSVCRAYCGGPKNVGCANGKKCADLSMTVKVATMGACGG
jgi:hypothetical protein